MIYSNPDWITLFFKTALVFTRVFKFKKNKFTLISHIKFTVKLHKTTLFFFKVVKFTVENF